MVKTFAEAAGSAAGGKDSSQAMAPSSRSSKKVPGIGAQAKLFTPLK